MSKMNKIIKVSDKVYENLSLRGKMGRTFSDVIDELLTMTSKETINENKTLFSSNTSIFSIPIENEEIINFIKEILEKEPFYMEELKLVVNDHILYTINKIKNYPIDLSLPDDFDLKLLKGCTSKSNIKIKDLSEYDKNKFYEIYGDITNETQIINPILCSECKINLIDIKHPIHPNLCALCAKKYGN